MKYVNARDLLPEALVRELQGYLQGGYVYIPADETRKRRWGERSGYRQELQRRNGAIAEAHRSGATVEDLAARYCLSESAIRKILYRKK